MRLLCPPWAGVAHIWQQVSQQHMHSCSSSKIDLKPRLLISQGTLPCTSVQKSGGRLVSTTHGSPADPVMYADAMHAAWVALCHAQGLQHRQAGKVSAVCGRL